MWAYGWNSWYEDFLGGRRVTVCAPLEVVSRPSCLQDGDALRGVGGRRLAERVGEAEAGLDLARTAVLVQLDRGGHAGELGGVGRLVAPRLGGAEEATGRSPRELPHGVAGPEECCAARATCFERGESGLHTGLQFLCGHGGVLHLVELLILSRNERLVVSGINPKIVQF